MKKYISADALKQSISDGVWSSELFKTLIDEAPAENVTEIKNGEWIKEFTFVDLGHSIMTKSCSCCNEEIVHMIDGVYLEIYHCPICGTNMKEIWG